MKYLIYMSAAVKLLNQGELKDILLKSRENNKRDNLTGMLLYSEGCFVQVLEGDDKMLEITFNHISKDKRHTGIITLSEGELTERMFADWSMGFKAATARELLQFEVYVDPAKMKIPEDKAHPALTMLKTFIESDNFR